MIRVISKSTIDINRDRYRYHENKITLQLNIIYSDTLAIESPNCLAPPPPPRFSKARRPGPNYIYINWHGMGRYGIAMYR